MQADTVGTEFINVYLYYGTCTHVLGPLPYLYYKIKAIQFINTLLLVFFLMTSSLNYNLSIIL